MLIDVLLLAEIIRAGRAHWGGCGRTGVGPRFDSCRRLKFARHRGSSFYSNPNGQCPDCPLVPGLYMCIMVYG